MSNDRETSAQTPSTIIGELSSTSIVAVCALVSLVLSAIVVLTVLDKPVDTLLQTVGMLIVPVVTTLLAARKMDKQSAVLKDVSVKVNGRLDALLKAKEDNAIEIASLRAQIPMPAESPEDTDQYSAAAIIERVTHDG